MEEFKIKFKANLDWFIQSHNRNVWIIVPPLSVYVRKARRIVDGELRDVFDVASAEVDVDKQGMGYFTAALECVIDSCAGKFRAVHVENVINERLSDHLSKSGGWELYSLPQQEVPSYIYRYDTNAKK
jgi:hypothetical protein